MSNSNGQNLLKQTQTLIKRSLQKAKMLAILTFALIVVTFSSSSCTFLSPESNRSTNEALEVEGNKIIDGAAAVESTQTLAGSLTLISEPNMKFQADGELRASTNTNPELNNAGQVLYESADASIKSSFQNKRLILWNPEGHTTLITNSGKTDGNNALEGSAQLNDAGQIVFTSYSDTVLPDSDIYEISKNVEYYYWSSETGATFIAKGGSGLESSDINTDGQVVFQSEDSNLPGTNGSGQIYIWDIESGTRLVSTLDGVSGGVTVSYPGSFGLGSFVPKVNDEGQVVFRSDARNLPGGDRDYNSYDVYLWNPNNGADRLTASDAEYEFSTKDSGMETPRYNPQINGSGQVVFAAVPSSDSIGHYHRQYQICFWDPATGITLVSSPDGMSGGAGNSTSAQINDAGQVVFESSASNLPGANGKSQIYLWDFKNGLTLVSSNDGQTAANGDSKSPQINNLGQVVFESKAYNLSGSDNTQIYLWDPATGITLVSSPDGMSGGAGNSTSAQINDLGQVVFESNASNLPGANGHSQIYLWEYDG